MILSSLLYLDVKTTIFFEFRDFLKLKNICSSSDLSFFLIILFQAIF